MNPEEVAMNNVIRMAVSVAAAAILAACGGGGDTGGDTGGDGGDGAAAASLTMTDNAFEPADLTVAAGAEVEVANDGQALHNLTVEGADIDEDVDAGASTTVTMDLDPGEYRMVCEYHEAEGMEGTLTVQ
jgi:plastocyanin